MSDSKDKHIDQRTSEFRLIVDKKSGYLENIRHGGMKAEHKSSFLSLLSKKPNPSAVANSLGFSRRAFDYALHADPVFKRDYDTVMRGLTDHVEEKIYLNAQESKGFMDRMAWVRAHDPDKWNPQANIRITHTASDKLLEGLAKRALSYTERNIVEGEIVQ